MVLHPVLTFAALLISSKIMFDSKAEQAASPYAQSHAAEQLMHVAACLVTNSALACADNDKDHVETCLLA